MRIFSIDNVVFKAISRVGDIFLLSMMWLLTSLPIVTIGASTTALFDMCIKILRGRDLGIIKGFFKSFKSNFLQSTIIWLIFLPIGVLLYCFIYYLVFNITDKTTMIVVGAFGLGILLPYLFTLLIVFAVQAVFNNPVKATIRTAFLMSMRHLPTSLLIAVSCAGLVYLCFIFPIVTYIMLMFGMALFAMIFSVRYLTIFRLYNDELKPDVVEDGKPLPSFLPDNNTRRKQQEALKKVEKGKVIR